MKAFSALFMVFCCCSTSVSGASLSGPHVQILEVDRSPVGVRRVSVDRSESTVEFGDGELVNIPPMMMKEYYYEVNEVPDQAAIKLLCSDNSDHIGCEFFVNVYHCPGCSSAVNGALAASMTAAGHQGGSCAPGFTVADLSGKFVQPMVAFRVRVEAGKHIILPEVVGDAKYIAIFGSNQENVCMWRSMGACEEPGVCTVEDGACVPAHFCPKMLLGHRAQGPDARLCPRNCLAKEKKVEPEDTKIM